MRTFAIVVLGLTTVSLSAPHHDHSVRDIHDDLFVRDEHHDLVAREPIFGLIKGVVRGAKKLLGRDDFEELFTRELYELSRRDFDDGMFAREDLEDLFAREPHTHSHSHQLEARGGVPAGAFGLVKGVAKGVYHGIKNRIFGREELEELLARGPYGFSHTEHHAGRSLGELD